MARKPKVEIVVHLIASLKSKRSVPKLTDNVEMMLFLFLILLQPFVQLVNCLGPRLISTTVNGMNEVAVKTRRVDTYKGSNAALSCTFSSSLSVKVLWYKDGALFTGGVR